MGKHYPTWEACLAARFEFACYSCIVDRGRTQVWKSRDWALRHGAVREHTLVTIHSIVHGGGPAESFGLEFL